MPLSHLVIAACGLSWNNPSATYPPGVEHHTFRSAAMGVDVGFNIYVPPEYAAEPATRFPVIYVLHGIGGNEGTMPPTWVPRFRAKMEAGLLRPTIVVFANGVVDGFYADARNGSRLIETSIVDELIGHVDATWRTNACASQRAITGFSMGGHGALLYYTKHPDRFSSVVAYAGALLDWPAVQQRHPEIASCMFGDDGSYFAAFTPWTWVSDHADTLRTKAPIRIAVGDLDGLLDLNRAMGAKLAELAIPHEIEVVPGCAHEHKCLWDPAGDRGVAIHEAAFAACESEPPPDPVDDTSEPAQAGGCAVGGGAGWPCVLALVVLARRRRHLALAFAAAACGPGPGASPDAAPGDHGDAAAASIDCTALVVTGAADAPQGATWVYRATDPDGTYDLSGVLLAPSGAGPFPAVVISHGKGGSAESYSRVLAETMRGWGIAAIATSYTHAAVPSGLPHGDDGASAANIARGWKTRQLLSCLPSVDPTRVAAHGHSMGAFVTSGLLSAHPTDFIVASHTAGGVNDGPPGETFPSLRADEARAIVAPYQLHHGDTDTVVRLAMDQQLDAVLTDQAVDHELHVYAGFGHAEIAHDATMLERVLGWYSAHGLL